MEGVKKQSGFIVDEKTAKAYSSKSNKKIVAGAKRHIEGEYLATSEIAARLGLNVSTAHGRILRASKLPGPITWAKLGLTVDKPDSAAILDGKAEQ